MSDSPLNDHQSNEVIQAAGYLSPSKRASFIRSVENRLRDTPLVTGTALRQTIAFVLASCGVSASITIKGDRP
jgi:hypothetical protein